MDVNNTRHIVIASCIGWGHLRGLCILSARLAKLRQPVVVTFFTARLSYDRVQAEISRDFEEHELHLRDRVTVVALEENQENMLDLETFDNAFVRQYAELVQGSGSVRCAKKEGSVAVGEGRIPDAVILDAFAYDPCMTIRKIHSKAKIYCWAPAPTSGVIPLLGPFGADTKGLLRRKVEERMSSTGESFEDAAYNALAFGISDDIITVPGLPAMYNYEAAPQTMPSDDFKKTAVIHIAAADFYHEADGIITPTFTAFDPPESMEAIRRFLALTNRKLYVVGPLLPSSAAENAAKNELRQSPKAQETEAFMERILRTHGEKSLVYISFGSMFWSAEPEKIWAFVDVLLDKKIPFIMAHASPFARVPDEIHRRVEAAGLGLLTSWAPQQLILNHAATGWFVSHCGVNSIVETVIAGVPIIAWPFGAEQAFNAVHCAATLNIAYELFEVRNKPALKVYRTGKTHTGTIEAVRSEAAFVLEQAFGPDGEVKRKNISQLREAAEKAWVEGGSGKHAVESLLAEI